MARPLLPKRRTSLAREFRDSCRAGPRVWFLVGIALTVTLVFQKFIWVALAAWLFLVLPAIIGGLLAWAVSEAIHGFRAARSVPTTTVGTGIGDAGAGRSRPIIEVQGSVVDTLPAQPAASVARQPVRP